jgi:hypothetical protein
MQKLGAIDEITPAQQLKMDYFNDLLKLYDNSPQLSLQRVQTEGSAWSKEGRFSNSSFENSFIEQRISK